MIVARWIHWSMYADREKARAEVERTRFASARLLDDTEATIYGGAWGISNGGNAIEPPAPEYRPFDRDTPFGHEFALEITT